MAEEQTQSYRCRPVLVVGQTPPPFHGQALMLERLVNADFSTIEIIHVRLAYSKSLDDVGRFQLSKVFHLLWVILRVYWVRVTRSPAVLYYPPAGPNRIPMYRDIIFLLATRWMFAKTIFHMQAGGISQLHAELSGPLKWLFERAYFYADAVIRLSEFTPEDAKGLKALSEHIVPNCVEDEFESYQPIADADSAQPPKILYLGTVCETKGVLDLLAACKALKSESVDFQLHIVGGFQPRGFETEVRARVAESGLAECTTMHGQLTGADKFRMLAAVDIFCFPSYYPSEAFPCVLVEAMSFALPVVSTQWRGIQSIIDEGDNGFLVAPRDISTLASKLKLLLLDPTKRKKLGENGRKKFQKRYTTAVYESMMEGLFLGLDRSGCGKESPKADKIHETVKTANLGKCPR